MILYDKFLYPRTYLELLTGNYYILNANNQLKQLEYMLDEVMGKGKFKNYPLLDIESAISKDKNVVLVEITNIDDNNEEDGIYRWFEVPQKWTRKEFLKRLGEI